jgi:hypothetical protein
MNVKIFGLAIAAAFALAPPASAQETVNGVTTQRGILGQRVTSQEIQVTYGGKFKGAHRIAITAFNVAFPDENHLVASTSGHSSVLGLSSSAKTDLRTTMTGVDHATRQRIADSAYKTFVAQLTAAGYEVVSNDELMRLAPKYAAWTAEPNFSQGRYGTYVAPTGRSLFWLQGDQMKRNAGGAMSQSFAMLGMMTDNPQAQSESTFVAKDANVGVLAVTVVVDYGVYSTSGGGKRGLGGGASASFLPGVSVAAGSGTTRATMLTYWKAGEFSVPATAVLQIPVRSEASFIVDRSAERGADVAVVADPAKFEGAANDVLNQALPKFVSVMAANR